MIIYGSKLVKLSSTPIPLPCLGCKHEMQNIIMARTFLTLFFIPVVPLRKKAFLQCQKCGGETKKRKLLKTMQAQGKDIEAINSHLKNLIKGAKTPLRFYVTTMIACFLLTAALGVYFYNENENAKFLAAFSEHPTANALILLKAEDSEFPYAIAYISEVSEKDLLVYEWNFNYSSFSAASEAFREAKKAILEGGVDRGFMQPEHITKAVLEEFTILKVRPVG